jgi:hypothetical protein
LGEDHKLFSTIEPGTVSFLFRGFSKGQKDSTNEMKCVNFFLENHQDSAAGLAWLPISQKVVGLMDCMRNGLRFLFALDFAERMRSYLQTLFEVRCC